MCFFSPTCLIKTMEIALITLVAVVILYINLSLNAYQERKVSLASLTANNEFRREVTMTRKEYNGLMERLQSDFDKEVKQIQSDRAIFESKIIQLEKQNMSLRIDCESWKSSFEQAARKKLIKKA